ncbi:hypothetical protein PspLS_09427 [Pyricularia sp. CBS 133598]|nr:hypothetical protein PspLS_09427 [Pyricularia sp. CBS 133598]
MGRHGTENPQFPARSLCQSRHSIRLHVRVFRKNWSQPLSYQALSTRPTSQGVRPIRVEFVASKGGFETVMARNGHGRTDFYIVQLSRRTFGYADYRTEKTRLKPNNHWEQKRR